jgi:tRNA splicing ligase
MLDVQKYLRQKSLSDLKQDLGIEHSIFSNLVVLNYSQIDSPKNHPIVMECRGLILEQDTWNVVCYPFRRFFNAGEIENDSFDYRNAFALEKVDGTLISLL